MKERTFAMSKELFNNVGHDIKTIAKVIANWILALHILFGIVIIICGCVLLSDRLAIGWVGFLIGFGIFGCGYFTSRLSVMILYAYGEITDRLISIDSKTPNSSKPKKTEQIKVKVEQAPESTRVRKTSPWECPFCGNQNPSDVSFCKSCGTEDIGV